ncbi:MAG: redoxin domain-containing protein [Polyangiaceae bacterium]
MTSRPMLPFLLLSSAILVGAPSASEGAEGPRTDGGARRAAPVDFTLETSAGKNRSLSEHRGKVVVVFYEDRHHTETNARTKEALARYGEKEKLGEKVVILAVANLKGLDFVPASSFARKAIRAIASRVGIEIWMDWKGAVATALGAADADANVVVVDKSGAVTMRARGAVSESDEKALFEAVKNAL